MKLYQNVARQLPQFSGLCEALQSGKTPVLLVGLSEIHKSHFIYSAARELGRPVLVVTEDEAVARRMCDDVNAMDGGSTPAAYLYPARDFTFRQVESASREYEQLRIGVLSRLLAGECPVCFASVEALLQRTLPPEELKSRTFTIHAVSYTHLAIFRGAIRNARAETIATLLAKSPCAGSAGISI